MNAETSKEHETFANISSTTNAFFFKQSNGYMPYLDSKGKSQNILTTTPLTHNSTLLQKPNKTDHLALNEGLPQQNAIQNILSPRFNRQGFNEDRPDKFEYPTLPSNIVTLFHSL
uniref:Uncharacterized protein n=1 Tax=Corethron hystrix TaxID=216773 RepID=A0A7S1BDN6_9STRA|mmetsp:Transcript_23646/g.53954  ORF Transcript_23646/g.53954 Transcript_23646/m.53954 type:complete len:115 (+) Transcript_23646:316-660(+)